MSDLTIDDMKRTFEENTSFLKIMQSLKPKQFRMMKVDPYQNCYCGSGQKFKFCCYKSPNNLDNHFKKSQSECK